ncbi:hypothetical protein C8R43DRAFT_1112449 [Mycena crocata]|nr:hypothetical protein C8R43DRAFT_1112449 [Mycena crocata]
MSNLGAHGRPLLIRSDNPKLNDQCWSSDDFASAFCCAKFNGTRVKVKGSDIQACSFHDIGQWGDCINSKTSSGVTQCQSNASSRAVTGGGMLVLGLLVGQILSAFVLA